MNAGRPHTAIGTYGSIGIRPRGRGYIATARQGTATQTDGSDRRRRRGLPGPLRRHGSRNACSAGRDTEIGACLL